MNLYGKSVVTPSLYNGRPIVAIVDISNVTQSFVTIAALLDL